MCFVNFRILIELSCGSYKQRQQLFFVRWVGVCMGNIYFAVAFAVIGHQDTRKRHSAQ